MKEYKNFKAFHYDLQKYLGEDMYQMGIKKILLMNEYLCFTSKFSGITSRLRIPEKPVLDFILKNKDIINVNGILYKVNPNKVSSSDNCYYLKITPL